MLAVFGQVWNNNIWQIISTLELIAYIDYKFQHMQPTQSNPSQIGSYTTISSVKHSTNNPIYTSYKQTLNPVYIIKIYKSHDGYLREKKVYQIQQVYGNYFVEACENVAFNSNNVDFIATKYSKYESLLEFIRSNVGLFSIAAAKFYIFDLFSKLKFIHVDKKIPFRTLNTSDIIITQQKQIIPVGWSKPVEDVQEQDLIYDCAEIFYYMLTNGSFREVALGFHGEKKKRFLSEQFWDTSKKKSPYLRYFPTDPDQLLSLVTFFKKITIKNEQMTLENVLQDEFFTNVITKEAAVGQLTTKQLQINLKKKLKVDSFINKKIPSSSQIPEGQQKRSSDQYEKIQSPFMISVKGESQKNEKQFEDDQQTQNGYEGEDQLLILIKLFLQTRLEEGLNKAEVFGEDWLQIIHFKVVKQMRTASVIVYDIQCQISFSEDEDFVLQQQRKSFELEVSISEPEVKNECIRECILRPKEKLHQVLVQKLEIYLTRGLKQSFIYCS